jgi:hypothetical protein
MVPLKIADFFHFIVFLILNSLAYMLSYDFILSNIHDNRMAKLHAIVIGYGAAQSTIGFLAGYCVARWCFQQSEEPVYVQLTSEVV